MKFWLIGMMGSGKTAAGRVAASNLRVPFSDTDQLVEQRSGMSISVYWAEFGEEGFREVERDVVASLETQHGIVATGGGVVLDRANRDILSRSGTVIWLDARPVALAERVQAGGERPLLASTGLRAEVVLETTLARRSALYEALADHRIGTDELTTAEVAREIELLWKR